MIKKKIRETGTLFRETVSLKYNFLLTHVMLPVILIIHIWDVSVRTFQAISADDPCL